MKKKKSKKEKKPRKKFALSELETVTYEQQIVDNNRQIARLRGRNTELEAEAERLKDQLRQLEESKADLTTYLEEVLQKRSQEAQELQERVKALEKLRKEKEQEYKKRENSLEMEFKLMEKNLTAEIKLAAGKLSALEDWRMARLDLMKKFDQQEKQMAEQEVRHRETLYETEKKVIIGKAKMQSELEKRLTELAESFRRATSLRLADATQRALRENLALRRELDELLGQCAELDTRARDFQERERDARLRAELHEAEAGLALEKVARQRRVMIELLKEDERASHEVNRLARVTAHARYGEQAEILATEADTEVERQVCQLQEEVRLSRERAAEAREEARNSSHELGRLEAVLAEARRIVVEALELQAEIEYGEGEGIIVDDGETGDACSSCLLDAREKLLWSLREVLEKCGAPLDDGQDEDSAESESMPEEGHLYVLGSLGIIPADSSSAHQHQTTSKVASEDLQSSQQQRTTTTTSFEDSSTECNASCSSSTDSRVISDY
ncbi:cilia- and flagella-associated protein 157-like [Copidosoma floridanum]|uniref:cilia- and flagella-associated protein 157-like n=1 Tax=Copidosoma floridanum TaxID=29053 RepID=UPI0006C96181|nr:cilia- and flagella-associated protein 157-like [Copidosoma floridanum]